ncbi:MAG: hypothetical protein ACU85E_08550 [Gammaproteobacteria bacterium]
MFEITTLFFDICLLKKGPQDIPPSYGLLYCLIVVYALISFLVLFTAADWQNAVLQIPVEIVLVIVFTKFMLSLVRKPERYVQTACALFGTDALISFFALPSVASMTAGKVTLLAFAVMLGFTVWHWLVIGHVFRHALSQSLSFGLGIAFLYIFAMFQILALLFPEAAVSPGNAG